MTAMAERERFYRDSVRDLIKDKNAAILVCGGGALDKTIFAELGFHNVTISNLDPRLAGNEYAPFQWQSENAEALSFPDGTFDYVVEHAVLHHTASPHKALNEMYRVARRGILAFEARDSLVMRLLERCACTQVYENTAVYHNACQYGGVNNTEIPNYIYRWTEREIEKTIQAYAPYGAPKFHYRYATAFPVTPGVEHNGRLKIILLKLGRPFFWLFVKLFPKQQNLFAFYIAKPALPAALFPWLVYDPAERKIKFNKKWGEQRFKK